MTRDPTIQDKFHCRKGLHVDGDAVITGDLSVNGSAVGVGGGGGSSGPTTSIDNGTVGLTAHDPAVGSDYLHFTGHILPSAHEQYDIGSADAKIRHLFLSDNSLTIGDTKAQEAFFTGLAGVSGLAAQDKEVVTTPSTSSPGASAVNQILAVTELPAVQETGVLYIVVE